MLSPFHEKREESLLVELASKFIAEEAGRESLITVTRAKLIDKGGRAIIYFTTFPDSAEENALNFCKRKRSDFREFIKKESSLARIPYVDFEIDLGEKNRIKIDGLSLG